MRIRTRAAGLTLSGACIAWLACTPPAHCAQSSKQFGEWSTVCSGQSYCTASVRVRTSEAAQPYAFQLRVSRFQSRPGFEVAFLSARERPAAGEAISVRIDETDVATLAPDTGYRAVAGGGTYLITDVEASQRMLAGMRTGKRVELSFGSALGKPVVAAFPLAGFARALSAIAGNEPLPTLAAKETPKPPSPSVETAPAAANTGAASSSRPAQMPGTQSTDQPRRSTQSAERDTPPQPPPPGRRRVKAVTQFACKGNEPAWHFIVDGNRARYARISEEGAAQPVALTGKLNVTGEGRTPDVDWRGKASGGEMYRAFIQEQRCVDSMFEQHGFNRFDYHVKLTLPDGGSLNGCCTAGLQLPLVSAEPDLDSAPMADLRRRPVSDWSHFLLEWHPAIAACLARTPGNSPFVTKAWAIDKGRIGVRTRNSTVGWFECVATLEGAEVQRIGPIDSAAAPVVGEERVVYTPTAQQPPAGHCYTHERVLDVDGNLLGWLSDNRC